MEEILASIRRIISEDDAPAAEAEAEPPRKPRAGAGARAGAGPRRPSRRLNPSRPRTCWS